MDSSKIMLMETMAMVVLCCKKQHMLTDCTLYDLQYNTYGRASVKIVSQNLGHTRWTARSTSCGV